MANNPYSDSPGYRKAVKTRFGYVVLYDREKGGDWIDGDTRWVISAYDDDQHNIALLDVATKKEGESALEDSKFGWEDWIECYGCNGGDQSYDSYRCLSCSKDGVDKDDSGSFFEKWMKIIDNLEF